MNQNRIDILFIVVLGIVGSTGGVAHVLSPEPLRDLVVAEFEGDVVFNRQIPIHLKVMGTDERVLTEITWIRFETSESSGWAARAGIRWSLAHQVGWRITVELFDQQGQVLNHPSDVTTHVWAHAAVPAQPDMAYAELDLGSLSYQGRRAATRFKLRLEQIEEGRFVQPSQAMAIKVIQYQDQQPIPYAVLNAEITKWGEGRFEGRHLYRTDEKGHCRVCLYEPVDYDSIMLVGQHEKGVGLRKFWSQGRALPPQCTLEMLPARSVGGIVQDPNGLGISGVNVQVETYLRQEPGTISVDRVVQTDASGRWCVDGLPKGMNSVRMQLQHLDYEAQRPRLEGQKLIEAWDLRHRAVMQPGRRVRGRVTDSEGNPVSGVTVMVAHKRFNRYRDQVWTLTDKTGCFQFRNASLRPSANVLEPQHIALTIAAPGFAPAFREVRIWPFPEPINISLDPGRTITGQVVDDKGMPVAGVGIGLIPFAENREYSVRAGVTDDSGTFRIERVPLRDVRLAVGKQGYLRISDYSVNSGADQCVITLRSLVRVSGRVTDRQTGRPIETFKALTVVARKAGGVSIGSKAGANGRYSVSFDVLDPEYCKIRIDAEGYRMALSPPIDMTRPEHVIDFQLERDPDYDPAGKPDSSKSPEAKVAGVVYDQQGVPVEHAVVKILPLVASGDIVTEADGRFSFVNSSFLHRLKRETLYVVVRHHQRHLTGVLELEGCSDNLQVILKPAGIIKGRIIDETGQALPKADIRLGYWTGLMSREEINIDAQGAFEIRTVPAGYEYSISVSALGYGRAGHKVEVPKGADQTIHLEPLVLARAHLSVSGIVVDAQGQGLSGIELDLQGQGQPWYHNMYTDDQGRFLIKQVCPGSVKITAGDRGGAFEVVRATAGSENVRIVLDGQDRRGTIGRVKPVPLTGKPMPDLTVFNVTGKQADVVGEPLLICFFDMQQRPSRRCIVQLSQQAKTLRKRGFGMLAVQGTELDENKLKEWIKENNIPFPVGMIQDDCEKTRFNWGVKSLPWLILTDEAHTVRAEGFGLGDLKALVETYENPKGSVEVRVTVAGGTDLLAGAVVHIRHLDSDRRFDAKSDDTGAARFSLAPGVYQLVSVAKKGYLTERTAKNITVAEKRAACIQIQLKERPKLAGTVRNRAGAVVPGTMLYVIPDSRNANTARIYDMSGCHATTDAQGLYELRRQLGLFASMKDRNLNVYARHIDRNLVAIAELENEDEIPDLTLTQGIAITGVVVDCNRNPIPDAKVSFRFQSWLYGYYFRDQAVATNALGRYEIKGLWPDRRYTVVAQAEGYGQQGVSAHCSSDAPNHTTEFEPLVLKKADLSVSGRVVDIQGKPVSDARVSCSGAGQPKRSTQTDANGRFILEGVCAGTLDVRAQKSGTTALHGSITSAGGTSDVVLVAKERLTAKRIPPLKLTGKPLPELADLDIDLTSSDAKDRALLICFWDMNQRPSRRCLVQLATQAQGLKEKGLTLLAIQASKVEKNELDAWIKEHRIPFPVGQVERNQEKAWHNWGVQSLPWLILTDKEHVVRAEGFGLDELEQTITR